MTDGARVLIAGGGVAGLEALLALHDLAGERARVTLVAPDPDFVYKPLLVEEPFDMGPPEQRALEPLARELGAEFVLDAVRSVSPDDHEVELGGGTRLGYDYLVVCLGGRFRPALKGVTTFPSGREVLGIDAILDRAADAGHGIAFVVPPGVGWPLPIYEVALMTQRRAVERGQKEIPLSLITREESPLAVFGSVATGAIAELLAARRIGVETGSLVHEDDGKLVITPGDRALDDAEVIALPVMDGPSLPGLPSDDGGFIPIDDHARVAGADDVYAAGDGTNFPIKQGGIATQQADAAAADIAHRLGAAVEPEPFHPVLRGKLITGADSLHLQADVAGGAGEGEASADCLWWPPQKISGRYLTAWLYHGEARAEPEPPGAPLDVEVALPREWHQEPMAYDAESLPPADQRRPDGGG
jgi:sulfide:quinone oxidoreductase